MAITDDALASISNKWNDDFRTFATQWLAEHSADGSLKMSQDMPRVYRSRPKGLAKVLTRLMFIVAVDPVRRNQSNERLMDWIASEMPGHRLSKGLLDQPLSISQIKKVNAQLRAMGRPDLPTGRGLSPSKIKIALRARAAGEDETARQYSPPITITDEAVIVNDKRYSRFEKGTRIKVGTSKLSVAVLEQLLKG